jgi:predicted deacetylase
MSRCSLVVSIHDVSPLTRDAVTSIVEHLAGEGIARTSLLVVPDHHHRGNIAGDPEFASWLRDLVAAGHEPVLHGYFHKRERRADESARTRFITRCYTADEGEFFDISFPEARGLLARGRDELTQCAGVQPTGFIAPAWLLSLAGEEAARDLGFAYTTGLKSVSDLVTGRVYHSQALCWSGTGCFFNPCARTHCSGFPSIRPISPIARLPDRSGSWLLGPSRIAPPLLIGISLHADVPPDPGWIAAPRDAGRRDAGQSGQDARAPPERGLAMVCGNFGARSRGCGRRVALERAFTSSFSLHPLAFIL